VNRLRWLGHLLGLGGATALLALCMFRPFLPGGYDRFAVTLSGMAQLVGLAGLLLVPVGALWLADEVRRSVARRRGCPARGHGRLFAMAALGLSPLVALGVSLPLLFTSLSLWLGGLALWIYVLWKVVPRAWRLPSGEDQPLHPAPLYLVCLPLAALVLRLVFVGPAVEFSRNRAMANSARLIADIESYCQANGRYPISLAALWDDYPTGVVGIERYDYEPAGAAYNVFFEQFAYELPTREIVVYNPRDEQEFTSHDGWILLLSPDELTRARGHFAVYDAGRPHWKYFWFD
jgi:hypothetical protein